jgi:glutamate/tyrosine decarboxylase-like PLP-dependent enzyme
MEAFRQEIGRTIALAREAESWIRDEPELELLAPAGLGVVCFRWVGAPGKGTDDALDRANERIQARIVDSGYAMMSSTRIRGSFSLRFCILNARTRAADVRGTLDAVLRAGRELAAEGAKADPAARDGP